MSDPQPGIPVEIALCGAGLLLCLFRLPSTRQLYVVLPEPVPLSAAKVQRMAEILEPFAFDAVYGAFSGRGQIDEIA